MSNNQKNVIYQITATGLLVAVAVLFSLFTFRIGNGSVYLVGIPIFLMPILLRWTFALMGATISVVLADLITGYIVSTWISVIAYGIAIVILALHKIFRSKWYFYIFLVIAAGVIVAVYFFLEYATLGLDLAIEDAIATAIQMSIVVAVVSLLYLPMRSISKIIVENKNKTSYF